MSSPALSQVSQDHQDTLSPPVPMFRQPPGLARPLSTHSSFLSLIPLLLLYFLASLGLLSLDLVKVQFGHQIDIPQRQRDPVILPTSPSEP